MKATFMSKMMRTATMLLLSAMVVSCGLMYHNADDIINDMRDARHAQYVNVGSGLLGLGRLISPTLSEAALGVTSVQVLDLSKCSVNTREKFRKRVMNLTKNHTYEEVVTKQVGYDTRTALIRSDGQYVNEIVLVNASDMTDVMVLIFGHINLENLERIINDQSIYTIK
jgi:hypothetical protein